jgi:hypothetical protein
MLQRVMSMVQRNDILPRGRLSQDFPDDSISISELETC